MTGRLLTEIGPAVLEMGWPDVADLLEYWRESPPAHELIRLIAMRLGAIAPIAADRPAALPTRSDLDALDRALGAN